MPYSLPPGNGPARASSARGPKEHWYWRCGTGSLLLSRSDRCCSAPAAQVWPLRCSLQHDHRMASQPHATSEALFYLVRAGLPHSPRQKDPPHPRHEGPSSVPGLSPDPRLQQPLRSGSFFSTGKRTWGGGGGEGFSLGCFLPARTREIPGARDAEQWAEELDRSSPDGELSRRT